MESSLYLTKILPKRNNSNVVDAEFMINSGSDKYWIHMHCSNYIFPFTTINNYQLDETLNQSNSHYNNSYKSNSSKTCPVLKSLKFN